MSRLPMNNGMTRSEMRALRWLKQTGHTHIEYTGLEKVDFKTDQGYYEVKRPLNGTLVFRHNQIQTMLAQSARLLIVPDRGRIMLVQPSEISNKMIRGFRVTTFPSHFMITINAQLDYEFRRLVGTMKGARRGALNECVEEALSDWVAKNGQRIVSVS